MRKKPTTKMGKKEKMGKVMDEYKSGKLRSGSKRGQKVKSRNQAIAIGLNESGQGRKPKKSGRNPAKDMDTDDFEKKYGNSKL